MALGFQNPCLLSSCSFWRALDQSAAWSDPAALGHPASPGAAGHYRSPALTLPAPTVTARGRGLSAPTPGCAGSAASYNSLLRFCYRGACHRDARLNNSSQLLVADILSVTSDRRRQRKCEDGEDKPEVCACGRGGPDPHRR